MKRRLLYLIVVLSLLLSLAAVPIAFADARDEEVSISISEIDTDVRSIDLRGNANKTIDMFVGEEAKVKTDILVTKDIVIENASSIVASYTLDESFSQSVEVKDYGKESGNGNNYLIREINTIKPSKAGKYTFVASYTLCGKQYFDYININVFERSLESMTLKPNVTTIKTNSNIGLDLVINGSSTLSIAGKIDCYINGERLLTLDNYSVGSKVAPLDVKVVYTDLSTGDSKEFESKLPVVKANSLSDVMTDRSSYGFMLKAEKGIVPLYVTAGSFPNITVNSKNVIFEGAKIVDSDKEGYDKYDITLSFSKFDGDKMSEDIMIIADNRPIPCTIQVINYINTISIVPESTTFESGKASRFHLVINGVKDVETPVKWTVNGSEQKSTSNVLEYKAISSNDITISATIGDNAIAEYKYKIDTSTNSIILTVVVSLVVIIICIPILIAIKKAPKPDLKAMIKKDNDTTIALINKLKADLNGEDSKSTLKRILKINTIITRSEKRAQQESFECENKAFGAALSSLSDAKELINGLVTSHKTDSKESSIAKLDTIIACLDSANATITKVEENM